MDYPWYQVLKDSDSITQGDIIKNCYIPLPSKEVYRSIINPKSENIPDLDIKTQDVIIMSQACDIANNKINSIVVCPIWPLETIAKKHEYFNSKKARESLRQGKEPAYHMLNHFESDNYAISISVVDFHRIFSLPKDFLKEIARKNGYRLRVLPPYREHLSQSFARYFMRVGLPLDISKDDVKNII